MTYVVNEPDELPLVEVENPIERPLVQRDPEVEGYLGMPEEDTDEPDVR